MNESQRELVMAGVGFVAVFVVFTGFLWSTGLFDFSDAQDSTKIVAASIALVGTFFTAMVTLTGLLLRQSMDRKNLELQKDNLRRMETETAIKAAELFKSTGEKASSAEIAGALFALSSLGQIKFAVRLLSDLWPNNRIDAASAVYIVDDGLDSDDTDIQYIAANTLSANATKLHEDGGSIVWPSSITWCWQPNLNRAAKDMLLDTIVKAMMSRPFREWQVSSLNWIALWLGEVVRTDEDTYIKGDAAAVLRVLVSAIGGTMELFHPIRGTLPPNSLKELAENTPPTLSMSFEEWMPAIQAWANDKGK